MRLINFPPFVLLTLGVARRSRNRLRFIRRTSTLRQARDKQSFVVQLTEPNGITRDVSANAYRSELSLILH